MVVSFDHGFYRQTLIENNKRVFKTLGVDSMVYKPNWLTVRKLMLESHKYAKSINAKRIQLSTATDNFAGQSLYESLGYIKDKDFYTYDLEIWNK